MTVNRSSQGPRWHIWVLLTSCVHSAVWGILIVTMPEASARIYGFASTPDEIYLWQGTGFFICLLAFGYALAAWNPGQHWGLVLIGLLAKFFGAIGMMRAVWLEQVSRNVLKLIPVNDVIWWIPFAVIVWSNIRPQPLAEVDSVASAGSSSN